MAPSVTGTTVASLAQDTGNLKLYSGGVEGAYKELAPVTFSKEAEELGSEEYAAAKVSRLSSRLSALSLTLSVPSLSPYLEQGPGLPSPRAL